MTVRQSAIPRVAELHRKPTPWPPFDVEAFARDSERRFRAAEARSEAPTTRPPPPPETTPLPPIDARVGEAAARIGPIAAKLDTGAVSREEGALLVRLELEALAAEARDARAEPLASLVQALRGIVEELGGIAGVTHGAALDVVVIDEDAAVRERVAMAVASMGHIARSAKGLHELPQLTREAMPDAILVWANVHGAGEGAAFCGSVRAIAGAERARVVVFTHEPGASLDALAREKGAAHCFRAASLAVERLAAQIAPVLHDLAE